MNSLEIQIRQLAELADETMPWLDPSEIRNPERVRELPPPKPLPIRSRPRPWIAIGVAALVIAVLASLPLLFSAVQEQSPPATEPSVPTTQAAATTTTTVEASPEPEPADGVVSASDEWNTELAATGSWQWTDTGLSGGRPVMHGGTMFIVHDRTELYRSVDGHQWEVSEFMPAQATDDFLSLSTIELDRTYLMAAGPPESTTWLSGDGNEWAEWSPSFDHSLATDGVALSFPWLLGGPAIGEHRLRLIDISAVVPTSILSYQAQQSQPYWLGSSQYLLDEKVELDWTLTETGYQIDLYRWTVEDCGPQCIPPWGGTRTLIHSGTVDGPADTISSDRWDQFANTDGFAGTYDARFSGLAVSHDHGFTFTLVANRDLMPDVVTRTISSSATKGNGLAEYLIGDMGSQIVSVDDYFYAHVGKTGGVEVFRSQTGDEWESLGTVSGLPISPGEPLAIRHSTDTGWTTTGNTQDDQSYVSTDGLTWIPAEPEPSDPFSDAIETDWGFVRVIQGPEGTVEEVVVSTDRSHWERLIGPEQEAQWIVIEQPGIWYLGPETEGGQNATWTLVRPGP